MWRTYWRRFKLKNKEPSKKATAILQESVGKTQNKACISLESMVSSHINENRHSDPLATLEEPALGGLGELTWLPGGWRARFEKVPQPEAPRARKWEEERRLCSRINLGYFCHYPAMNGLLALFPCPLTLLSSFRDLRQSSCLAKLRPHTRDLVWEMGKERKDLALLDSTVECRHLELPPNKKIHNEWEVISPSGNPGTTQMVAWMLGSQRVIRVHKKH